MLKNRYTSVKMIYVSLNIAYGANKTFIAVLGINFMVLRNMNKGRGRHFIRQIMYSQYNLFDYKTKKYAFGGMTPRVDLGYKRKFVK